MLLYSTRSTPATCASPTAGRVSSRRVKTARRRDRAEALIGRAGTPFSYLAGGDQFWMSEIV